MPVRARWQQPRGGSSRAVAAAANLPGSGPVAAGGGRQPPVTPWRRPPGFRRTGGERLPSQFRSCRSHVHSGTGLPPNLAALGLLASRLASSSASLRARTRFRTLNGPPLLRLTPIVSELRRNHMPRRSPEGHLSHRLTATVRAGSAVSNSAPKSATAFRAQVSSGTTRTEATARGLQPRSPTMRGASRRLRSIPRADPGGRAAQSRPR
jgi:hypothetical protein